MDFYTDKDKSTLCSILTTLKDNGIEPPNYVLSKTADDGNTENLPAMSFADQENREYPIHTKADTWLSAAYFSQKQADLPKNAKDRVKSMIHKGAELWDLDNATLAQMDKVLGPKLEKAADDGETKIKSEKEMQEYCDQVLEKFAEDNLPKRKQISEKLLKIADDKNWSLNEETRKKLEKTAGQGTGMNGHIMDYLYDVKTRLPKKASQFHSIIDTCINDLQNQPEFPDQNFLHKVAGLTDMVLKYKPQNRKELPEHKVFQFSQSEVGELKNSMTKLPGNRVVWKTAIEEQLDPLKEDIYALSGKEVNSVNEAVQHLQQLTPVLSDRLLGSANVI